MPPGQRTISRSNSISPTQTTHDAHIKDSCTNTPSNNSKWPPPHHDADPPLHHQQSPLLYQLSQVEAPSARHHHSRPLVIRFQGRNYTPLLSHLASVLLFPYHLNGTGALGLHTHQTCLIQ
ncbi:hypothetical protein CB0940_09050 [Cercospora beticola]|uniref:Uncharacterized protein n=1 Tax=Cercospora beticola TaxID=122368 RepID=A0A2G5HHR6_CERBT|nr:hypothetical protein CB0940_09050 [Cercospora beticola]PIA92045.1 hypothetical protein CB0940_09050 [Cercospora beticola]